LKYLNIFVMDSFNWKGMRYLLPIAVIIIVLYLFDPEFVMVNLPPHIRPFFWLLFIGAGLVLGISYLQSGKPAGVPARTQAIGEHASAPPSIDRPREVSGVVVDYGANRIGDIDKLLLQCAGEKLWLHFPPHTAAQVINLAVKETTVQAGIGSQAKRGQDSLPVYEVMTLRSPSLGTSLQVRAIPPPPPDRGKETVVTGDSVQFRLDEQGRTSAIILGGRLVPLHPKMAESLAPLLRQASAIEVKGYERDPADGFVNSLGLPVVKPYSINIDKTNYVLQ
jgi:hypothetical protein